MVTVDLAVTVLLVGDRLTNANQSTDVGGHNCFFIEEHRSINSNHTSKAHKNLLAIYNI